MKTNTFKSIAGKAFLILGFLSFSFFVSCSNDSNPEAVAEKFLNHVNKGEFKEAKEYCDEQTASLIGMMESMAAGAKKDELKNNDAKVEIISSEVKDDKATVKYKTVGGKAPNAAEQTLNLVKVDGKWKVTIDKENANKEGAKAPGADMEATDSLAAPADAPVVPADSTTTAE